MYARKSILIIFTFLATLVHTHANATEHPKLTKTQRDSLRSVIEAMLTDDQQYRWMIMLGETDQQKLAGLRKMSNEEQLKRMKDVLQDKAGISKAQKDSLWILQTRLDSVNFIKLSAIIRQYGFPHKYIESYKASTFLLHASPAWLDDSFFNMLKEEVNDGDLPAYDYAIAYDRWLMGRHLPPLYCMDHEDKPRDINETNKARAEIGLGRYK